MIRDGLPPACPFTGGRPALAKQVGWRRHFLHTSLIVSRPLDLPANFSSGSRDADPHSPAAGSLKPRSRGRPGVQSLTRHGSVRQGRLLSAGLHDSFSRLPDGLFFSGGTIAAVPGPACGRETGLRKSDAMKSRVLHSVSHSPAHALWRRCSAFKASSSTAMASESIRP